MIAQVAVSLKQSLDRTWLTENHSLSGNVDRLIIVSIFETVMSLSILRIKKSEALLAIDSSKKIIQVTKETIERRK